MSLSYPLELYAYTPTNTVATPYGWAVENLTFSTITPGGFGHLQARLKLPNAVIPPELRMFGKVALMAGPQAVSDGTGAVFLGRWDEPGITLDRDGLYLDMTAQGAATALKDDPIDTSYVAQTAQQILIDQLTNASNDHRPSWISIDADTAQILPDNPATQYTQGFDGKDIEQVLNALNPLVGDYMWQVWDHPKNKDASGFPTWQVFWHSRDVTTTHYLVQDEDIISYQVRPAVEYSYNAVDLRYKDSSTLLPAPVKVSDSRLGANNTQGSAPIPYRLLRKDLTSTPMTSAQASTIANALLGQYKNGGYKITLVLGRIRDASGNEIPLWRPRADRNAFLPVLSLLQTLFPTTIVASNSSSNPNQYYITETEYREGSRGTVPQLTITCNTYSDQAAFQIARLQYEAQQASQSSKTAGIIQAPGSPEKGKCGIRWQANAVSTDTIGQAVNFKTTMTNVPSSITFTASATSNAGTPQAVDITNVGFQFEIQPAANGAGYWRGTYQTVGN